jgi:hypothetical protein
MVHHCKALCHRGARNNLQPGSNQQTAYCVTNFDWVFLIKIYFNFNNLVMTCSAPRTTYNKTLCKHWQFSYENP